MFNRLMASLAVVTIVLAAGCNRSDDTAAKQQQQAEVEKLKAERDALQAQLANAGKDKTPAAAAEESDIKAPKNLGAAGKTVQSFFRNWQYKRFRQMHAVTANSRSEEVFIKCMGSTPIRFKNVSIISEEQVGDDWDVKVSLDVTDAESTFAALMINLLHGENSLEPISFVLTPQLLEIEKFMKVDQTWRVTILDKDSLIDLAAGNSKLDRHTNIMNYVLDAGIVDDFPTSAGGKASDRMMLSASAWLATIILDLNKTTDDAATIMRNSKPLISQAERTLGSMVEKMRAAHEKE